MLPYYWKNTCLLSPPRGPLGLDFYSTHLATCIMMEAAPEPIFGTRNAAIPRAWCASIGARATVPGFVSAGTPRRYSLK